MNQDDIVTKRPCPLCERCEECKGTRRVRCHVCPEVHLVDCTACEVCGLCGGTHLVGVELYALWIKENVEEKS